MNLTKQDKKKWPLISITVPFILAALCILLYILKYTHGILFSFVQPCVSVPSVLSFEDPSELAYFKYPPSSLITTTSKHYKDGYHSLLWEWQPGDKLSLPLGRRITGMSSGIKIWIYRNESSQSNLTITLSDGGSTIALRFNFSLNFKGWRVAWVKLMEAKTVLRNPGYNFVEIKAPMLDISTKVIFVDLICLSREILGFQSRDDIVPPIGNGSIYSIAYFWQQVYKWGHVVPPPVDAISPLTAHEKGLLQNITLINKRLLNWFANESIGPSHYKGNLKKRWESLVYYCGKGKMYIKGLNITVSNDGVLTGSPLFARNSEFGNSEKVGGNKKLGWVVHHVLFPLVLEYYFSAKPQNIDHQIAKELKDINCLEKRNESVQRITKNDEELSQYMVKELNYQSTVTETMLRDLLGRLNKKKLEVIMQLLEYITDQGWAAGSAFGSLDHEVNKVGWPYVHSLLLLKPTLIQNGKLDSMIQAMKWYNELGEIYQTKFEYNGTSADRMRTIMLYRLETILMNPERTIKEQREKLRDMQAYRRCSDNFLLVNTAIETAFKADLSSFHHRGVYGSSYNPSALTIASTIHYFLDGTSYSLSSVSRENIRKRLEMYTNMAVLYSLPNSISGRFPNYSKAILIEMLPAFALLSAAPQYLDAHGKLEGVKLGSDSKMIKLFLKLYQADNAKVQAYLGNGVPGSEIVYLRSLGNLEIMQAIFTEAKASGFKPERSSTGHWVMNYGPLSIHRRQNWVVSIKGFNRFFWDYEASSTENLYGLYQSHGALQISNSEQSLTAYDVEHGWDWSRVPGTTTIKMNLEQMDCRGNARFYQSSKLVGGVLFVSKDPKLANGVFAMRFQQPQYDVPSYKSRLGFSFKKSVFFYNNLVVCLGSDITVTKSFPNRTQTTLFQDKLLKPKASSTIYINGETRWLSRNFRLRSDKSAAILDTNGNGYYVPNGSSLNVQTSLQISRTDSGLEASSARYATVWLDHGVNPLNKDYEYAILVATDVADIEGLKTAQESKYPRYVVLEKNSRAHVVVVNCKESLVYGYSFFDRQALTEGPVRGVSHECVIMAEVDGLNFSNINLSVSSPDINFNTTEKTITNVYGLFYTRSIPVEIMVYLNRPVLVYVQKVLVNGKSIPRREFGHFVEVVTGDDRQAALQGSRVHFKRMVNGDSVEAFLISGQLKVT